MSGMSLLLPGSVGLPAASLTLAELPTQVVARFARFVDACLATQPTHVREFAAGLAVLCSAADGTEVAEVADLVGLDQHLGADAEDQLRELGLLAARDVGAEAEAEADRAMLLDDRGADANHANERIEKIRRRAEG